MTVRIPGFVELQGSTRRLSYIDSQTRRYERLGGLSSERVIDSEKVDSWSDEVRFS